MNHRDVIRHWKDRDLNRYYDNTCRWQSSSIVCYDDQVIYSYGRHFPLAVRLPNDAGCLKNGDPRSVTTARHQREIQAVLRGPTTSFSALGAAGIDPCDVSSYRIVDATEDNKIHHIVRFDGQFWEDKFKGEAPHGTSWSERLTPWKPPMQGSFMPSYPLDGKYIKGTWHILGGQVYTAAGDYFVSGLDEGNYFVSQLPHPVKTYVEALNSLAPNEVRQAYDDGKYVYRQGEWFFVDTGMGWKEMAAELCMPQCLLRRIGRANMELPRDRWHFNAHTCRHVKDGTNVYATGFVRHTGREHRTVKLGDTWWLVYRNTAIQSWSVGGNFD